MVRRGTKRKVLGQYLSYKICEERNYCQDGKTVSGSAIFIYEGKKKVSDRFPNTEEAEKYLQKFGS